MIGFLVFIASYIIGIIGWIIIVLIDNYIDTYDELRKELCDTPAFIPFINILTVIGLGTVAILASIVMYIYKYCGIEKWWNKTKCKKLPFRE